MLAARGLNVKAFSAIIESAAKQKLIESKKIKYSSIARSAGRFERRKTDVL